MGAMRGGSGWSARSVGTRNELVFNGYFSLFPQKSIFRRRMFPPRIPHISDTSRTRHAMRRRLYPHVRSPFHILIAACAYFVFMPRRGLPSHFTVQFSFSVILPLFAAASRESNQRVTSSSRAPLALAPPLCCCCVVVVEVPSPSTRCAGARRGSLPRAPSSLSC